MKPLDGHDELTATLRALRDEEAHIQPPACVRSAVLAAWDSADRGGLPRQSGEVAKAGTWRVAALAAGVALAVALTRLGGELQSAIVPPQALAAMVHLVGEPIADGEAVRVVRMRMAPAVLASLGIRSTAGELADAVDVDVIVGEDGVARAIRLGM
jgi:hypothetical protein